MSSVNESLDEELNRNPKYLFHELLEILTLFYSFRELSKILDVPVQTLWKYRTLRAAPERESALKLISKIKESGLIDNILDMYGKSSEDPLVVLSNPGLLELLTFIASERVRKCRSTLILAMPDPYSSAIASLIAVKNRVKLCLTDRQLSPKNSTCTVIVDSENRVTPLCMPIDCFSKKNKVFVISSIYMPGSIKTVTSVLRKYGQALDELFIAYGSRAAIEREVSELKEARPNYYLVFDREVS